MPVENKKSSANQLTRVETPETEKLKVTPKKEEEPATRTMSKSTVFVLMLAFGIHEFFEGIAFGLQSDINVAV
jgi:zinc transporter ZupT